MPGCECGCCSDVEITAGGHQITCACGGSVFRLNAAERTDEGMLMIVLCAKCGVRVQPEETLARLDSELGRAAGLQ